MAANFFPIGRPKIDFTTLDQFFMKYMENVGKMNITTAQKDQIIKMNCEVLSEIHTFQTEIVKRYQKDAYEINDEVFSHAITELDNINSTYRRQKIMKNSKKYVEPIELSSGFKFNLETDKLTGKQIRSTVQCTFQYISVLKTLTALFTDESFEKLYLNFNQDSDHKCVDGIYERFCCGEIFKNSVFFQYNPLAIQLKLFIDDFEPCAALKSHVGKHKTTGIYIQINNMPQQFLSKVNNIYLYGKIITRRTIQCMPKYSKFLFYQFLF